MDLYLLYLFNQVLAHPLLDPLMIGLTALGLTAPPVIAALFVARGDRRTALAIFVALTASGLFTVLFYMLGMRPRPPLDHAVRLILPVPPLPSFPSGHAALSFAVAVLLVLRLQRRRWALVLLGGAAAISFSRLYLGHHYPSDVVAGALMGGAIGAACYGIVCRTGPPAVRLRWLLWPQIALVVVVTQMAYLGFLPWHLLRWPNADKVLHFLLFGLIAFWLNLWTENRMFRVHGRALVPVAVLVPFVFALGEEGMQAFASIRTASFFDLAADLAGLLFFWGLSTLFIRSSARAA